MELLNYNYEKKIIINFTNIHIKIIFECYIFTIFRSNKNKQKFSESFLSNEKGKVLYFYSSLNAGLCPKARKIR